MEYTFRIVALEAERLHVYLESKIEKSENGLQNVINEISRDCYTDWASFFRYLQDKIDNKETFRNITLDGDRLLVDSVEFDEYSFRDMNDTVILDKELLDDILFMKKLNRMIMEYSFVKEETNENIERKSLEILKSSKALELARRGLVEFSRTGNVSLIDNPEDLENVYDTLVNKEDEVLATYGVSVSSIKNSLLNVATGAGIVASVVAPVVCAISDNMLLGLGITIATTATSCYLMHLSAKEQLDLKFKLLYRFKSSFCKVHGIDEELGIAQNNNVPMDCGTSFKK